jgi:hypothetical protein
MDHVEGVSIMFAASSPWPYNRLSISQSGGLAQGNRISKSGQ